MGSLLLPLTAGFAHAEADTALDLYRDNLAKSEHSAQAELLVSLILSDCRSLSDIDGRQGFQAMVTEGRSKKYVFGDEWEVDVRERWAWCEGLLEALAGEDFRALELRWIQSAMNSGSPTAALIHRRNLASERRRQQFIEGVSEASDSPVANFPLETLRNALIEAYDYGDPRLTRAALFEVHVKRRHDEAMALGGDPDSPITTDEAHELAALRNTKDELPWDYLSCKYERRCTDAIFVEQMGEWFSDAEILQFMDTAAYYERCIKAKDWVSLGLVE